MTLSLGKGRGNYPRHDYGLELKSVILTDDARFLLRGTNAKTGIMYHEEHAYCPVREPSGLCPGHPMTKEEFEGMG